MVSLTIKLRSMKQSLWEVDDDLNDLYLSISQSERAISGKGIFTEIKRRTSLSLPV